MSGEDVKGLNPVYVILFCLGLVLGAIQVRLLLSHHRAWGDLGQPL